MMIYLLAPDLRTLGGFEGQLAALAVGLAEAGQTVKVFFREPVPAAHPYRAKMLQAGVSVEAPPAWQARWLNAPAARRRRLLAGLMWAAAPVLAVAVTANAVLARRGWRRAWQGGWGRLRGRLSGITEFDGLTWRMSARLDRARRQAPPDIVDVQHSMLPQGICYARQRGLPVVYTEYGAPSFDLESVWAGLRPVINQADFIIGRAEASLTGLREVCGAARPGVIIPNAVTAMPTAADCDAPPEGAGPVVVTTIGRLAPEKGPQYVLEALRRLVAAGAPVRLVFAGDGPLRAALTEQALAWGLSAHVTMLGAFDDLAPVLRATDIVAHPSLNDGRSVAVLEAMAWGRPVVATRVGGLPELVVDGETGRLVPPADAAALAQALLDLIADPAGRQRMGRAGRERFLAGAYTPAAMVAATLKVYEQVIRERAAERALAPA
jgi:glycosyltransferase involved in cell wall biosynthesis